MLGTPNLGFPSCLLFHALPLGSLKWIPPYAQSIFFRLGHKWQESGAEAEVGTIVLDGSRYTAVTRWFLSFPYCCIVCLGRAPSKRCN
ncbi:uncharacterized protein BDV17DRAFT_25531 [Aspergillus undulatus]|uniref:uncharacterized protein n=1 Tax=Aspergillus undulatus TaxID=1810928 RepID=UPI003CCE23DB